VSKSGLVFDVSQAEQPGRLLEEVALLVRVVRAAQEADRIRPQHDQLEVLLALGQTQTDQGKLSDAIQSYENCLALKPDEFYATYNLANAYYTQKKYAKSATYYEKAFAQKPDFPDSLVGLGASQLAAWKLPLPPTKN